MRPGVFDTREWTGDVRVGGQWRASGIARGQLYALEGEFLEVESPKRLVHTWKLVGKPAPPTKVIYLVEPAGAKTRVTLRHAGITDPQTLANTAIGWGTSFQRLAELLSR